MHEEDDGITAVDPQTHVHIKHHSFIEATLNRTLHVFPDDDAAAAADEMAESPLHYSRGGAPDMPSDGAHHHGAHHHGGARVEPIPEAESDEDEGDFSDDAGERVENELAADGATAAAAAVVGKKYRGMGALKGKGVGGGRPGGLPRPLARSPSQRAAIESTAPVPSSSAEVKGGAPLRVTQSREYEGGVIVEDLEEDDDEGDSSLAHDDFDASAGRVIEVLGAGSGLSGGPASRGGHVVGRTGREGGGARGGARSTSAAAVSDVSDPPETFDFSAAAPARLELLRTLAASGPAAAKELVPRDNLASTGGSGGWSVASLASATAYSAGWVLSAVGLGVIPRKLGAAANAASAALHKPFFSSTDVAETTATLGAFACVACAVGAVALAAKRGYL